MLLRAKKIYIENETKQDLRQSLLPITLDLADVSKGIYMSSKELNTCSQTLMETSHEVESHMHINEHMVGKVKEEVYAINQAAEEIQFHAKQNERLSSENLQNVVVSRKDLNISVNRVEALFHYFDEVEQMLEKLQSYSKSIGNITTYIDQIASKTSIVSINASIEAARAGEAGRGFMVITDSIKGLANQSKEFSNHISSMLQDMTICIEEFNEISKMNRENITHTKESISMLEKNLENIEHSTFELDKNIQGTLTSSNKIKDSVEKGDEAVQSLTDSFNQTIEYSETMMQAIQRQQDVVAQITKLNEKTKAISENQLNAVLDGSMEEKLIKIGEKLAAYIGPRDTQTLQRLAKKYLLASINYIDDQGYFEAAANEKSIGFNIFKVEPQYKQFKADKEAIRVYPLSRNLFTGEIVRYASVKHIHTNQLISVGFNLESLKVISEMTMEEIEQLG